MDAIAEVKEFQLSKVQWIAFRFGLYGFSLIFACVGVFCLVHRVPNPHSIIPKSVIALINALAMFLFCNKIDLAMAGSKTADKEKRRCVFIVAIAWVGLLGLGVFIWSRHKLNMTGGGDPFFPCIWLFAALMSWLFGRDSKPTDQATSI